MFNNDDRGQVTPLELRQAKFATVMRGFDKNEVTSLLEEASASFEHALRENDRLRQEIARLEGSLQQYRELESGLKSALMTAQKAADDTRVNAQVAADDVRTNAQKAAEDVRANAQLEAARIVREAEGQAALLIERAQAQYDDVQREIDGMRLKRREAETTLEATISALTHTLEFVREQEHRVTLRIA